MASKKRLLSFLAAGALLAGATFALRQDEGGFAPPMPEAGPEHKVLAALDGTWDATVSVMGQESKGVMTIKLAMNGLWLIEDYEGDMMGQNFAGHGLIGYDPAKKMYVSTWIDGMTTNLSISEGTYDKEKKELVLSQEAPDPMSGKMVTMKQTTRFKDRDHWSFHMSMPGPDGADMEMMSIEYARKK